MNFGHAISMLSTPSDNAGRAQLAHGRLAVKGWTPGMRRAAQAVVGMVFMLLAGAVWHHQVQPLVGNLLFWGALAAVFMGALGLIISGDRDARRKAQVELSSIWAVADSRRHAQLQGTTALALLSSRLAAGAIPAIAKQKCDFSPPATPGGRAIAHPCLTPRLAPRPHAAA